MPPGPQPKADCLLVQSGLDVIECGPFLRQARTEILVELDLVALGNDVAMFPCQEELLLLISMDPHYDGTQSAAWARFRCKAALGSIEFTEIGKDLMAQNLLEQLSNELGWRSCLRILW